MSILEFIAEMTRTLIWPLTIVLLIVIFRKKIVELIDNLNSIKYKDFQLDFKNTLENIGKQPIKNMPKLKASKAENKEYQSIKEIAEVSPKSAVIESWAHLEHSLIEFAQKCKIKLTPELLMKPLELGNILLEMKLIDDPMNQIIRSLRLLRNQVVHYEKALISKDDAAKYSENVFRIISYFNSKSR